MFIGLANGAIQDIAAFVVVVVVGDRGEPHHKEQTYVALVLFKISRLIVVSCAWADYLSMSWHLAQKRWSEGGLKG